MSHDDSITRRGALALGGAAVSGVALSSLFGESATAQTERYTVEVTEVNDGDTLSVRFPDESVATLRVLGVDTAEKGEFDQFERPEEWEGLAYDYRWDPLDQIAFDSTCSLYAADGTPLTDDSKIVVWAEDSATTENNDGEDPAVAYDDETQIPLVAQEGSVVGFGTVLIEDPTLSAYESRFGEEFIEELEEQSGEALGDVFDDEDDQLDFSNFDEFGATDELESFEDDDVDPGEFGFVGDHEEFLINIWNDLVGEGNVLWDEGHGQFYTLDKVQRFVEYAAHHNYDIESAGDLTTSLQQRGADDDADALVITTPEAGYTAAEFDAIRSFLDNGGTLFLHDQADFGNFDQTAGMNVIARELGLSFRWNDDQVIDSESNSGVDFIPQTEQFNTDEFAPYFLGVTGIDGGKTSRTTPHLVEWADRATEFARERLAGETIDIAFDTEQTWGDSFGRLLTYIYYDATGDGSRDRLYNRELVEEGYARLYSSGFARFHEFRAIEEQARQEGRGVWEPADISSAPSVRNRPVEELFFPEPVTLRVRDTEESKNKAVPEENVLVSAHDSATRSGGSVEYDELPLGAIDAAAGVAALGGNLIEENYEQTEEFPVNVSTYENFVLVTNLIEALSERSGLIHIDGGHGQFGAPHGSCEEDAAYFQRYLEGQGLRLEQVTELTAEHLTGRALVVTGPAETDDFTLDELSALSTFRDNGGAIILLGAANQSALGNLNAILSELGSSLRFSATPVTDGTHSRNDNPALVETTQLNTDFEGLFGTYDGTASLPAAASELEVNIPSTETNSTTTNNSSDGSGPGFTLPGTLAGLGGAGYLLKRRLTDTDGE
jgi:endonuclease YncB( thermonuclease family)